jgi:hypothetical protein
VTSLGEPHDHHPPRDQPWQHERRFGISLRDEAELRRLDQVSAERRRIRGVTRVL